MTLHAKTDQPVDPGSPSHHGHDDLVAPIIAEFSEVFVFARSRWARFAEESYPDLRGSGLMLLRTIVRRGPVTATGLGQMLNIDKAVVSRQVARLRELELISAEPAEEDRRVFLIRPTGKAEAVLDELHAQIANDYQKRFAGWSEADLSQLSDLLHRFNSAAHDERTDSPAIRCAAREHHEDRDSPDPSTAPQ